MFLWANRNSAGVGTVAKVADSDGIIAGQIVLLYETAGVMYARKVISGDTDTGNIGIAFIDPTKKTRETVYNASLTSKEWELAAVNTYIAVIRGEDLLADTDRLADRNYPYGTKLTIDYENAGWKVKGEADTEYARVEKAGIITSSNGVKSGSVRIKASIG